LPIFLVLPVEKIIQEEILEWLFRNEANTLDEIGVLRELQ
jgi:hypothetical protein